MFFTYVLFTQNYHHQEHGNLGRIYDIIIHYDWVPYVVLYASFFKGLGVQYI
jgi:hypothetical protein